MILLAIDTSTKYLSLAFTRDGKVLGRMHKMAEMSHSSLLVPMIDKLLKKARVKLKDLDVFCVSIGPGSFTGLRICVATVKGLAYALNKPVVTVPTLDVIAHNAIKFKGVICPVIDARKKKVYACLYKSDGKKIKRLSKYMLLPAAELALKLKKYKDVFILGDGAIQLTDSNYPTIINWYPKADIAARLGAEEFKMKRFVAPEELEPMYIYSRECDVTGK